MSLKIDPTIKAMNIGKVGVRNLLSNADAVGNEDGKVSKTELASFLVALKRERDQAMKDASSKAFDMSGFMPGMQQMADLFSMMDGGSNPLMVSTPSYEKEIQYISDKYDGKIQALAQMVLGATPKVTDTPTDIDALTTQVIAGDDFLTLSDFGATAATIDLTISDTGTAADNKWLALKAISGDGAEPKENKMLKTILKLMGMPSQLLDMMNGNMEDVNPIELMQQMQNTQPTPSPLMGNPVAIPLIFMLSKDDSSSTSSSSSSSNDMMMMLMMTMAFQGMGSSSKSSSSSLSGLSGSGSGGLSGLNLSSLGSLGGGGSSGLGSTSGSSSLNSLLGSLNLGARTLGMSGLGL